MQGEEILELTKKNAIKFDYDSNGNLINRLLIDYFQVTFDNFNVQAKVKYMEHDNHVEIENDFIISDIDKLNELLEVLGFEKNHVKSYDQITKEKAKGNNGFEHQITFGEHVIISWGKVNSNGNYCLMLTMKGQACREFENHLKGNWLNLFKFCYEKNESFRIKRLDLAYDNFNENNLSMHELEPYVREKCFASYSKNAYTNLDIKRKGITPGFTIYIGSSSANRLAIYDKIIEQKNKGNELEIKSNKWDRYEIRFKNESAKTIVERIVAQKINNDSNEFLGIFFEYLNRLFEPKELNDPQERVRDKKTWHKWSEFVITAKKARTVFSGAKDILLDKTIDWLIRSVKRPFLKIALALGAYQAGLILYLSCESVLFGLFDKGLLNKDFEQVKTYLETKNLNLNDIKVLREKTLNEFKEIKEILLKRIDLEKLKAKISAIELAKELFS